MGNQDGRGVGTNRTTQTKNPAKNFKLRRKRGGKKKTV